MTIALNGGSDGTPDDVDFIGRRDPDGTLYPLNFIYYHVQMAALTPSGSPIHGGTYITLFGAGFRKVRCSPPPEIDYSAGNNTNSTNATAASDDDDDEEEVSADPVCVNVTQAANQTQPRCKFEYGNGLISSTIYGSSTLHGNLVCHTPPSPKVGWVPLLVSLNGVDYSSFPDQQGVLGVYAVFFYTPCDIRAIEPPGGPVVGGTLINFIGSGLDDFGQEYEPHLGVVEPQFIRVTSMGAANGGTYMVNGRARKELYLTRGRRYTLEVVAMGNPVALTLSQRGGALANLLLVTTGPDANPLEYGEMTFIPDASLPNQFYYQSSILMWSTTDVTSQRITLLEPLGVSKLRFGETQCCGLTGEAHPLGTIRARNGSMIQATTPPQPVGTQRLGVVFSPNGAEEDYITTGTNHQPIDYTYYDEVTLEYVVPAGTPIHGGTNITIVGSGFDQAVSALPDERLRCLFDPGGSDEVLPQGTPVHFRNATMIICPTPPSLLGRPPYLMHGKALGLIDRLTFTRRVEWSRRICLVALNAILQSAERHLDPTCVRPPRWRHARRHLRCRPRCLFLAVGPRPLPFWRDRSAVIRRQRHDGTCTSPPASARDHASNGAYVMLHITLNGVDYSLGENATSYFEYYQPIALESVWPLLGAAAEGGTIVTLYGQGFHHKNINVPPPGNPDAPKCLFGTIADVGWLANTSGHGTTLPSEDVSNATKWAYLRSGWSDTEAVCILPRLYGGVPGSPRVQALAISLNGQQFDYGLRLPSGWDMELKYAPSPPPSAEVDVSGDLGSGSGEAGSGFAGDGGSGGDDQGSGDSGSGSGSRRRRLKHFSSNSIRAPLSAGMGTIPSDHHAVVTSPVILREHPHQVVLEVEGRLREHPHPEAFPHADGHMYGHQEPRTTLNFTVYDMPTIEVVTPSSGPAIGGTYVRVHGHALDALLVPGVSRCYFGPHQWTEVNDHMRGLALMPLARRWRGLGGSDHHTQWTGRPSWLTSEALRLLRKPLDTLRSAKWRADCRRYFRHYTRLRPAWRSCAGHADRATMQILPVGRMEVRAQPMCRRRGRRRPTAPQWRLFKRHSSAREVARHPASG